MLTRSSDQYQRQDLYNRPKQGVAERMRLLSESYWKCVAARMARILPAFGFGGIGNKAFRTQFQDWVEDFRYNML